MAPLAGIMEGRDQGAIHAFATNIRRTVGILLGRDDDCHPQPGANTCEKPAISSTKVTWIIVGAALGSVVVGTLAVLLFLHLRRRKRDKREDLDDRFQMADYGLDELPQSSSSKKRRQPQPPNEDDGKWSNDGSSPQGYGRRSRDPLQVGTEPKYTGAGAQSADGHLNPFDDATSVGSGANPPWPKRESSQLNPPAEGR